ncbi:MAG: DUF2851 family protein [Bacteroidetes bacterium]|nr:DUF2851 family protein [Bacteroidota bacterium]
MVTETLLHFVWKYKLFDTGKLRTQAGEPISILQSGIHNFDAGPDFLNARIKIGNTIWAGHVELHINDSDWEQHGHHRDSAYDTVVLHVVYNDPKKMITNQKGETIPTLVLRDYLEDAVLERYNFLMQSKAWIPCESFLPKLNPVVLSNFRERLLIERLEGKNNHIQALLNQTKNDWEQVTYQMLARYFGSSVNREAFESLAQSLPISVLSKYQGDAIKIEALLFGQSGLLDSELLDEYPRQLRTEFNYLKRLHQLTPLHPSGFKFLRLRPSNFPTLRLAQLAALLAKDTKLFSKIINTSSMAALHRLFDVKPGSYWHNHYLFDKPSEKVKWHIGKDMKNTLLINVVAPLLFCYGKYKDEEAYCDRAMALLEAASAERNSIIDGWQTLGVDCMNAAQTQSMIQLKKEYCDKHKCLHCAVGISLLKHT